MTRTKSGRRNTSVRRLLPAVVVVLPLAAIFAVGCICHSHSMRAPDRNHFRAVVASPALRDSLDSGCLLAGMPNFVIKEIFADFGPYRPLPVASVGSRQELRDTEGWGRVSHDPGIKVYMCEYPTSRGKVAVWILYPDFYRMGTSVNDTLVIYWQGSTQPTVIQCLLNATSAGVGDSLNDIPPGTSVYGEIRHVDNPDRTISYWYRLQVVDPTPVILEAPGDDLYPIDQIEIDGRKVSSFRWRNRP